MSNRRKFLKNIAGFLPASMSLPFLKGCGTNSNVLVNRDYFKEIGVKPFVNAATAYSALGGRNMFPEVIEAMEYAGKRNVIMEDLQDAVGKQLASLIECEAAMVSAGACSAMILGTAACITGKNEELIRRVPDLRGMKDEVIIQKSHRYSYDHAVRNCGIRYIEVDSVEDVDMAVNEKTAMMFFCHMRNEEGKIKLKEFADLGNNYKIPTLIDGSNTVPPLERLSEYLNLGFDLAAFSGGKGMRGPYSAGLLLGRKDLIEAARLNASPNSDTIGRGMKVSKEEILGMLVAVETCMKYDYASEGEREEKVLTTISEKIQTVSGIQTKKVYPETEGGRPHLQLYWDKSKLSVTNAQKQLREGEPCVETCYLGLSDGELEIGAAMLKDHEIDTLVKRLSEVLPN